ncbi:MAG: transposase [Fibrobacterota bacterium]
MKRYKFKYHKKYRLQDHDYSSPGYYFVTLVTRNRELWFGEYITKEIMLSEMGYIAQDFWLKIPESFPNAELDAWVVMPDHFHALICLRKDPARSGYLYSNDPRMHAPWRVLPAAVPAVSRERSSSETKAGLDAESRWSHVAFYNDFPTRHTIHPLIPHSISSILNHFKGNVTRACRKMGIIDFAWQPRYHDCVLCESQSVKAVRRYIRKNPFAHNKGTGCLNP